MPKDRSSGELHEKDAKDEMQEEFEKAKEELFQVKNEEQLKREAIQCQAASKRRDIQENLQRGTAVLDQLHEEKLRKMEALKGELEKARIEGDRQRMAQIIIELSLF